MASDFRRGGAQMPKAARRSRTVVAMQAQYLPVICVDPGIVITPSQ
jgi:hypothetical protein